jgi:hypothetical protein
LKKTENDARTTPFASRQHPIIENKVVAPFDEGRAPQCEKELRVFVRKQHRRLNPEAFAGARGLLRGALQGGRLAIGFVDGGKLRRCARQRFRARGCGLGSRCLALQFFGESASEWEVSDPNRVGACWSKDNPGCFDTLVRHCTAARVPRSERKRGVSRPLGIMRGDVEFKSACSETGPHLGCFAEIECVIEWLERLRGEITEIERADAGACGKL